MVFRREQASALLLKKENIIDIIAARNREEELEYILCKNYAENNKNIKLKSIKVTEIKIILYMFMKCIFILSYFELKSIKLNW